MDADPPVKQMSRRLARCLKIFVAFGRQIASVSSREPGPVMLVATILAGMVILCLFLSMLSSPPKVGR
jgi:hypothetical protein